jgi:hypothetical protein
MGGSITVDSAPGRGSTVAFTARFTRQPHSAEGVAVRPSALLHHLPVLIVDDNATIGRVVVFRGVRQEDLPLGRGRASF